jgi:hypothetical protein
MSGTKPQVWLARMLSSYAPRFEGAESVFNAQNGMVRPVYWPAMKANGLCPCNALLWLAYPTRAVPPEL